MADQRDVMADLITAGEEVDRMVSGLDRSQWRLPTPAPGWTIAHQIAHLAATFRLAGTAAADPEMFTRIASRLGDDFDTNVAIAMASYLANPPEILLEQWRTERAAAERALAQVPAGQTVPWLVRPLPAPVLAAAGMMELFGHGQDIADTLGLRREHSDALLHLVGFAVRTWDFGYLARGMTVPSVELGFELTAPSGAVWRFGPTGAPHRITGPAVDLCLLVTRRRHRDDLALRATGAHAEQWLEIAQAYRGPAGPGRTPGQFADVAA